VGSSERRLRQPSAELMSGNAIPKNNKTFIAF
jgi:hypothetical protein